MLVYFATLELKSCGANCRDDGAGSLLRNVPFREQLYENSEIDSQASAGKVAPLGLISFTAKGLDWVTLGTQSDLGLGLAS